MQKALIPQILMKCNNIYIFFNLRSGTHKEYSCGYHSWTGRLCMDGFGEVVFTRVGLEERD